MTHEQKVFYLARRIGLLMHYTWQKYPNNRQSIKQAWLIEQARDILKSIGVRP